MFIGSGTLTLSALCNMESSRTECMCPACVVGDFVYHLGLPLLREMWMRYRCFVIAGI